MKTLIVLLLISTISYGQCSTRNPVISAALGYAATGPTLYVEAGSYSSVPLTLSYFGGLQIATREERNYFRESKKETPQQIQYIDAYGRLALKISGYEGESLFYHFITAYGSVRGNVGASYRLYKTVDNVLIGIEPTYSLKNGGSIQILITSRF